MNRVKKLYDSFYDEEINELNNLVDLDLSPWGIENNS